MRLEIVFLFNTDMFAEQKEDDGTDQNLLDQGIESFKCSPKFQGSYSYLLSGQ